MLDDKLREILLGIIKHTWEAKDIAFGGGDFEQHTSSEAIAQIKQAFADEGYLKIEIPEKYKFVTEDDCMTGQEWYDRFEKLWQESYVDTLMVPKKTIFDVAKKASSLN